MKAVIMRENPRIGACIGPCDVLDELEASARHLSASFALIGSPASANRMLHKL
jgi:hypothetical protein